VLSGMAPQTAHGHVKVPAARVLMSERHPMHVASSAQASSPDHHAAIAVTAAGTALQQSASGLGSDTDITAVVSSSSVLDAINNDLHSTEHTTYVGESAAAWVGVALTLATAFLYACQYVLYDHLLHSKPKAAPAAAPASAGLQIIKGGASADQQAGASMLQRDSPGHGHSTSGASIPVGSPSLLIKCTGAGADGQTSSQQSITDSNASSASSPVSHHHQQDPATTLVKFVRSYYLRPSSISAATGVSSRSLPASATRSAAAGGVTVDVMCKQMGMWGLAYTCVYLLCYTLPNWDKLILQPLRDQNGKCPVVGRGRVLAGV